MWERKAPSFFFSLTTYIIIFIMKFKIKNLDCPNCARELEEELSNINGVEKVNVDFINQTVSFAIPNKQWLGMEKYIAVLNDCNESVEIALDEAIAVNIIPSVIAKAIKAEKRVDVLAGLSASFDSNEISISRKAVKSLGQFELHK